MNDIRITEVYGKYIVEFKITYKFLFKTTEEWKKLKSFDKVYFDSYQEALDKINDYYNKEIKENKITYLNSEDFKK